MYWDDVNFYTFQTVEFYRAFGKDTSDFTQYSNKSNVFFVFAFR